MIRCAAFSGRGGTGHRTLLNRQLQILPSGPISLSAPQAEGPKTHRISGPISLALWHCRRAGFELAGGAKDLLALSVLVHLKTVKRPPFPRL